MPSEKPRPIQFSRGISPFLWPEYPDSNQEQLSKRYGQSTAQPGKEPEHDRTHLGAPREVQLGDPSLADHDRPLNARGRRDAPMIADRLTQAGVDVRRIVSSTATRARTTAATFGAALGVEVELDPELYLAPASRLLEKASSTGAASVMLVAHDPGLSDLATSLSGGDIEHMPTCAVARFVWLTDSWDDATTRAADSWTLDTPR